MRHLLGCTAAFAACFASSAVLAKSPGHNQPTIDSGQASVGYHHVANWGEGESGDGGWDYASVDPATNRLYVARAKAVSAYDLTTGTVLPALASAQGAHSVIALDAGRVVFETDGLSGDVRFLDAKSGRELTRLHSGKKPDGVMHDPSSGLLAVMNGGDGSVTLIDPRARRIEGTIQVGGKLEAGAVDGKGMAFVNVEDRSVIAKLDLRRRRNVAIFSLPGCEGPTGIALVAHATRLITACANKTALVLDPADGHVIAHLAIGDDPDAIFVDEKRGLAFIPCGGSGTLVPIAIGNDGAVRALPAIVTEPGARTGAVDPRTGYIYLPTARLAPASGESSHPQPLPGTFHILVLAPETADGATTSAALAAPTTAATRPAQASDAFVPDLLLTPPPPSGSLQESQEIATLRGLIANASPERMAQAKWDAAHEDPSAFNAVMGRDLTALPATAMLLEQMRQRSADLATAAKKHFQRLRPYGVARDLPTCTPVNPAKSLLTSYPSGHATIGYSVAEVLARLVPDKAPAILARARDYALSRQICGVHFPSDTEASHVLGTWAALQLLADPANASTIARARAELAETH